MSSVVLSSLRAPVTGKKNGANPSYGTNGLVPNIRMFSHPTSTSICSTKCTTQQKESTRRCGRHGQTVGQSGTAKDAPQLSRRRTVFEFSRASSFCRRHEGLRIEAGGSERSDGSRPQAVIFQMDLLLQALKPGLYLAGKCD